MNILPEDEVSLLEKSSSSGWAAKHRMQLFGWVDGGISSVTASSGSIIEAPATNRFSNQVLFNAAWIVLQKKTNQKFSWGFRSDFYTGADAALLRSQNHFGPGGPRWGTEVREAHLLVHTPWLFEGGIDWAAGRINFPTGAETVFGAYQPLYSRSYFWIHGETSGTALLVTAHPTPRVDVIAGTTMGYNSSFILRGRAPAYLASVLYRPLVSSKRQLSVTVYTGPKPIAATASHAGHWQTLVELQVRQAWTPRFSQTYQASYIADVRDPGNGNGTSVNRGAFLVSAYTLSRTAALHTRLEWFDDRHGTRIAIPGVYSEATVGVGFHPNRWLELRPEARGDFSGQHSFGSADTKIRHRNQFSLGFEVLIKGRMF